MSKNSYPIKLLIFLLLICSNISCEKLFTGSGPQPSSIDGQTFEPMLNVLGILRPDSLYQKPASYIHLEGSFDVTKEYPDSFDISDAQVVVYRYENDIIADSVEFDYSDFNSAYLDFEYRADHFFAEAGKKYGIRCRHQSFRDLTGSTTVPLKPRIIENSLNVENEKLTFTIERDSLAKLYDIYFFVDTDFSMIQVLRPETGDIPVALEFAKGTASAGLLIIYAYDLNLSEYKTYNVIIKPNTYQPNYSTVDNGFGCLGSLNMLQEIINF